MRTAVTLGITRGSGKTVLLAGIEVDIHEQNKAIKKLKKGGAVHDKYESVELWESGGHRRRVSLITPKEASERSKKAAEEKAKLEAAAKAKSDAEAAAKAEQDGKKGVKQTKPDEAGAAKAETETTESPAADGGNAANEKPEDTQS